MRLNWRTLMALMALLAVLATACASDDSDATTEDSADGAAAAEQEPANPEEPADAEEPAEAEEEPAEAEDEPAEGGELSGEVNLDGSSTVGPLSEVAAESYQEENPGVTVSVGISGTGGGFERFCIGETDGNNSSRPIKDDEIAICEENGIGFDFVTVANDALSVIVNPEFPVDCLTTDQVNQIWRAEDFAVTWGEVEGLDLPEDIASEEILAYGPGTDSGTFDFFTEVINGESGNIRDDFVNIGEDDQAAVNAISGDTLAIGYTPFSFAVEAGDAIKPVAIDAGDGCIEGSLETVQDGSYAPLGRGLFVYFSDTALARPEVLDFARFYIENAPELAEIAEYIPLTDEQIDEATAKIETLAGG